jgi:hypothetical protein
MTRHMSAPIGPRAPRSPFPTGDSSPASAGAPWSPPPNPPTSTSPSTCSNCTGSVSPSTWRSTAACSPSSTTTAGPTADPQPTRNRRRRRLRRLQPRHLRPRPHRQHPRRPRQRRQTILDTIAKFASLTNGSAAKSTPCNASPNAVYSKPPPPQTAAPAPSSRRRGRPWRAEPGDGCRCRPRICPTRSSWRGDRWRTATSIPGSRDDCHAAVAGDQVDIGDGDRFDHFVVRARNRSSVGVSARAITAG